MKVNFVLMSEDTEKLVNLESYQCSIEDKNEIENIIVRPFKGYMKEQIKDSPLYKTLDNNLNVVIDLEGCLNFDMGLPNYTFTRTSESYETLYSIGEGDFKEVVQVCLPCVRFEIKTQDKIRVVFFYYKLV